MLDEANAKRRKLDREKRFIDRPQEGESLLASTLEMTADILSSAGGLTPLLIPRALPQVPLQHRRRLGFESEMMTEMELAWSLRHDDVRTEPGVGNLDDDSAWNDLERMGVSPPRPSVSRACTDELCPSYESRVDTPLRIPTTQGTGSSTRAAWATTTVAWQGQTPSPLRIRTDPPSTPAVSPSNTSNTTSTRTSPPSLLFPSPILLAPSTPLAITLHPGHPRVRVAASRRRRPQRRRIVRTGPRPPGGWPTLLEGRPLALDPAWDHRRTRIWTSIDRLSSISSHPLEDGTRAHPRRRTTSSTTHAEHQEAVLDSPSRWTSSRDTS